MNHRKDDAELVPKLKHQPQQCNRIRTARNGNPDAVSRPHQVILADVAEHGLRQLVHGSMLQPQLVWVGHSCPTRSYNHSSCGSDTPVRHEVTTTASVGRTLLSDMMLQPQRVWVGHSCPTRSEFK